MKRIVVDTNVLISFLTDRDAEQQARAAGLFRSATDGEVNLVLHQAVIAEMVYVMQNLYKVDTVEIAGMIDDLLCLDGIKTIEDVVWSRVLELWPSKFGDFTDALLASAAVEVRYDSVATFDRRFVRQLQRTGLGVWQLD